MALPTPTALKAPKVDNTAHLEAPGLSAPVSIGFLASPLPWALGGSLALISIPVPLSVAVGLDAAGKTTILYKLKLGEIVTTIPTIGEFGGEAGRSGSAAASLPRICCVFCPRPLSAGPAHSIILTQGQSWPLQPVATCQGASATQ